MFLHHNFFGNNLNYKKQCTNGIPCWMLYSGFDKDISVHLSLTFVLFIVIGVVSSFYKWIMQDRQTKRIEIFNDHKFAVSGRFFNSWDWDNNSEQLIKDYSKAVLQDINFEMSRELLLKNQTNRSFNRQLNLCTRRTISIIINLVVILGSCYAIIVVQDRQEDIKDYLVERMPKLKTVATFIPSTIISLFNFIVPTFNKFMVKFEKWDFPETNTRQEIWRSFLF